MIQYVFITVLMLLGFLVNVLNYRSLYRLGFPRLFCITVVIGSFIAGMDSLLSLLLVTGCFMSVE